MGCRSETQSEQLDAEFTTLGYYEPGFIHLRVNTHDDLTDLSQLTALSSPPVWASTFLHEYIHFLQDITSTHGLLNFLHAVEHLKNANKQVLDDVASSFSIPLTLSNHFNWETNRKLKNIYRGRATPSRDRVKSITYLGYTALTEQISANSGEIFDVPKYQIEYYDNGAQTKMACHFGSIHIKEYMAHALQNQFAPGTLHDELPYLLVELIVKKEVPTLGGNVSFIIALCDASLMDFHPARLFFDTLERIKRLPAWIPADVDSVYASAFKDVKLSGVDGTETIESLYCKTAQSANQAFRDSLKADVFKDNVLWFEELITEARKLRLTRRGFVSQLVTSPGVFSSMFTRIIDLLGIPFTTDAESRGYFVPPTKLKTLAIQPYYPKVFQAISQTFDGHRACSLHPFCEARKDRKITNDDCLKQPWARVRLTELCPYAQMWRTWGLEGKTPLPPGGPTD